LTYRTSVINILMCIHLFHIEIYGGV
jgi:hypothetical protein